MPINGSRCAEMRSADAHPGDESAALVEAEKDTSLLRLDGDSSVRLAWPTECLTLERHECCGRKRTEQNRKHDIVRNNIVRDVVCICAVLTNTDASTHNRHRIEVPGAATSQGSSGRRTRTPSKLDACWSQRGKARLADTSKIECNGSRASEPRPSIGLFSCHKRQPLEAYKTSPFSVEAIAISHSYFQLRLAPRRWPCKHEPGIARLLSGRSFGPRRNRPPPLSKPTLSAHIRANPSDVVQAREELARGRRVPAEAAIYELRRW